MSTDALVIDADARHWPDNPYDLEAIRLRGIISSLADRIAGQADALARHAEKDGGRAGQGKPGAESNV